MPSDPGHGPQQVPQYLRCRNTSLIGHWFAGAGPFPSFHRVKIYWRHKEKLAAEKLAFW
jgi:hypothetical protein